MTISLSAPRTTELKPRIVIFGIGGAGGNAVNNMIDAGLGGVEFVVANTDAQQLQYAKTDRRVQLGAAITQGLGAGAHPEVGMSAAEESEAEIDEHLEGAHMVFITAGMGGGTGTGAAPVIAKRARERGILTVGVVTKPFTFEGRHRMRLADAGIQELQRFVDTLIIIPNQNLFRVANERTTFAEAFGMADQVLHSGVRSITDLMVLPGLINLDFADVRTVMTEMGKAMMGTGEASGDDRALHAAQNAIQNPLLDETSLKGAKAVLVNVTGGTDMTLLEVDEAANTISNEVDPEANIIFGAAFDPSLDGKIRVSVVATGMDSAAMAKIEPKAVAQPVHAVARPTAPVKPEIRIEDARKPEPAIAAQTPAPQPAVTQPAMRMPDPRVERRVFGHSEPETVRSFNPEKNTLTGGRRVDIREPRVEEVRATADENAPISRIVDPLVADDDLQGDLYLAKPAQAVERTDHTTRLTPAAETRERERAATEANLDARFGEPRKSGWRGLFGGGRPRPEQQRLGQAQMRTTQQAQPVEAEAEQPAGQDDLEIPSFLRRLAN
jgi:cell division protein FtsZ